MASNFGLSIPEPSTPTKSVTVSTDHLSLSSPSSVRSGSDSSIVNTGGIPIATLRTPTKGSVNLNIAPKQPIMMSPPKLYIKGTLGGVGGTSVAQLIRTTSTSSGGGQTPVYQAVSNNQNGRVQYVKLVTDSSSGAVPTRQIITQVRPLQHKVVTTATASNGSTQQQFIQNILQPGAAQIRQAPTTTVVRHQTAVTAGGQRVILPAASPHQTIRITGAQSLAHIKSQLPVGATILSSNDSSGQMLAFLPNNQSLIQQKAPVVRQGYPGVANVQQTPRLQEVKQESLLHHTQQHSNESPSLHLQVPPTTSSEVKQKKPCNCTKSQCLKLYCDCFANGEFCSNCNCQNCFNNLGHEEERQKAIKQCLDRNPLAFHPKIGKGAKTDGRRHQKGCNCKRSGCLKNYCECFEAKIPCGTMCKCVGCKNYDTESKSLMSLADAADLRHSQAATGNHRLPYHELQQPVQSQPSPHTYLKKDVIGAVMDCLIAQCREAESAKCKEGTTEKVILEEFGRCLNDIIKASSQQGQQ